MQAMTHFGVITELLFKIENLCHIKENMTL